MVEEAFTNIVWFSPFFLLQYVWEYLHKFLDYNILREALMAELYSILKQESKYFDKSYETQEAYNNALKVSTTVYVGNLSFFTTQDSLR